MQDFWLCLAIWSWSHTIVDFRKELNLFLACQGFAFDVSFNVMPYLATCSRFAFYRVYLIIVIRNPPLHDDINLPDVIPGFLYLWTFSLLKPRQFFWWCWFSSFALSHLMKNWWLSTSFGVFTFDNAFN